MKTWEIEISQYIKETVTAETEEEATDMVLEMFNNQPAEIYIEEIRKPVRVFKCKGAFFSKK